MRSDLAFRVSAVTILVSFPMFVVCTLTQAQVRGVYPVGMSATNSGVTPEAGFTYSNVFIFFSRDEEKGAHGEVLATGQPYHDKRGPALDPQQKERIIRHHIRRLGKLGVAVYRPLPAPNHPHKGAASKPVPE